MRDFEICYLPGQWRALDAVRLRESACAIIDVIRATSTIVTALAHGASGVQPVADAAANSEHSVFASALLAVLNSNNQLLTGQHLFRETAASMALRSANAPLQQAPEYAPIQFAGHEAGEFFLMPAQADTRVGEARRTDKLQHAAVGVNTLQVLARRSRFAPLRSDVVANRPKDLPTKPSVSFTAATDQA